MEPDTLVVWLLKQARVYDAPTWECVMCGKLHPDLSSWPCCPPHERGYRYEDFHYESEHGYVFDPEVKMVGPVLDLWDIMGFWDKKFSTWQAQLKQILDAYDGYLETYKVEAAETAHIESAQALVREALVACLVSNGGKPITITELVKNEPKICESAVERLGTEGSVRHGVLKIIETDPEVRKAGTRKGFPIWTLSDTILAEYGFDNPDSPVDEAKLDEVKRELVQLANKLIQETGRKSWTVRKFMARFQTQAIELLDRVGATDAHARDLGLLFSQFQDAFCVVGYGQNVAHWALREDEVEANQHLHQDQFAKFTGTPQEGHENE
jgi:hypothetical protein